MGTSAPTRLIDHTAVELRRLVGSRAVSAGEVTEAFIEQAVALDGPDGSYDDTGAVNAFLLRTPERAREGARAADARLEAGGAPALCGVPVAVKDVYAVRGMPLTCGVEEFSEHRARGDSTVWRRLEAAGTPLLGITQAQRLISGLETEQTGNPWDLRRIAGGSSGGSAAAVAARMTPLAMGTETSGSIVVPALCCGITGLKPSHGLISLHGVWPGVPSLDVAGPLARTAEDCALLLRTLAGRDLRDPWTRGAPDLSRALELRAAGGDAPLAGLRIGVAENDVMWDELLRRELKGHPLDVCEPAWGAAARRALGELEALGAEVVSFSLPPYGLATPRADLAGASAERVIRDTEEPAFLGAAPRQDPVSAFLPGAAVPAGHPRRRGEDGRYAHACWLRARDTATYRACLRDAGIDAVLVLDTGSTPPTRHGVGRTPGPRLRRRDYESLHHMGAPIITFPVAHDAATGMPLSVQLTAPRWEDPMLLRIVMEHQARHPEPWRRTPATARRLS